MMSSGKFLFMLSADQTSIDDEAMKLLADEMYSNQKLCTWTSTELHDKYMSYGGQLTLKQMFTKLVTYLGGDVVVLNIEGCASIVGFREFVGKMLKVTEVDTVDEERWRVNTSPISLMEFTTPSVAPSRPCLFSRRRSRATRPGQ